MNFKGWRRSLSALAVAVMVLVGGRGEAADATHDVAQCVQDFQAMAVPVPGMQSAGEVEAVCRCQIDKLHASGNDPEKLRQKTLDDLAKLMADSKNLAPADRVKAMAASPYMKDMQIKSNILGACLANQMGAPPAPPTKQR